MLLATVCASGLLLVLAVVGVRRNVPPLPVVSTEPMAMQGFRSTLYDGDRVRLRVSGDSVTISNAKFFGPFSIGFLYSLVARNVTLETFPTADARAEPATQALSVEQLSALAAQQWGGMQLAHAELGPVTVIEHRDGQEMVILHAAFCRSTLSAASVVCRDGVVERDGAAIRFRQLSYDGETLRTTP